MVGRGKRRALGAKSVWRIPFRWLALFLCLLSARPGFSQGWDFTHAGDPNRNWGGTVTESVGYDDNFNATEKNQESGARISTDVKLRASIPFERLFVGMQYNYDVIYPQTPGSGHGSNSVGAAGINQTHNLNLSANYTANPRLTLGLTENFVNSLEPSLVQNNTTVVQDGTYEYNNVGASMNFLLSPRWTMTVVGGWDIWEYQSSIASNNNHQDYTATLSALYALDTRTTIGLNYQYGSSTYVDPGIDNGLNSVSQTLYLSFVRRFNPQLSLSLNGGYTIHDSADGTQGTSPSAYALLTYNYGPADTITLTLAQALSQATVGVTRQFSAQQNSSLDLQVNHRITVRLHVFGDIAYTYSSFTQPLGGSGINPGGNVPFPGNPFIPPVKSRTVTPNDQALTFHLEMKYDFRDWMSAVMDYYYTELTSSDPGLIQPFTRNQISAGIALTY